MPSTKKTFVLDTNVILHDSTCIHQFGENDIVLPITVLEELDRFKKGNDIINFHARKFVRTVDEITGTSRMLFDNGIPIGEGLGRISVHIDGEFHPDLAFNFPDSEQDHRILNTAYTLSKENPDREVVLITKDVNLRMKAKSVGLRAEDYTSDHVKDISILYTGCRLIEDISAETVNTLYEDPQQIDRDAIDLDDDPLPNEFFIIRSNKRSALTVYDPENNIFRRVDKHTVYNIMPRNAEQTFAVDALTNPQVKLATLSGKAGTGKTLIALAAALSQEEDYDQIYLARPIVPLSNKDTGYLPGDLDAKLNPFMQPLYDNLGVIKNHVAQESRRYNRLDQMLDDEKLKITPLSYIRGRSLVNIFFIVDEAQNLTPHEIKTIITRAGENTKIIFTGDIFQIDHPYLDSHSNGLSYLIDKMRGQKIYSHITMQKGERSELAELASNLL